jgi:hypothetical protein
MPGPFVVCASMMKMMKKAAMMIAIIMVDVVHNFVYYWKA